MQELHIIYRDEHLVAIDKPAGLLVHRSPIDRHETRFALQLLRDQIGQRVYPVHRLDKPTSGVLLFALSAEVAAAVSEQFAQRRVGKTYLAVSRGHCPASGLIDHPLADKYDKMVDGPRRDPGPARSAQTRYRCLARAELDVEVDRYPRSRYSLVELQPLTGRKHQLRRHMKHLGYPIIGDAKHGKGVHNRFFQRQFDCHRLLLACTGLEFSHPTGGERVQLQAGLDDSFRRVVRELGWAAELPPG